MFLFKKIVAPFLFPVPLTFLLLLAGLWLLWFTRRRKTGKILVSLGFCVFALCSFGPPSKALLAPLEQRHPAYDAEGASGWETVVAQEQGPPAYVVVLGGGHVSDPSLPVTSQLNEASLVRLVEGIRIHRQTPGSKLVLSGGAAFGGVPEADLMARMAEALGVASGDILREAGSWDTEGQARLLRPILGERPFILVTSASHMPRSMRLFQKQGLEPVAAPTGHMVREDGRWSPGVFFPGARCLGKAETAVYEYLGIAWAWLRGQV